MSLKRYIMKIYFFVDDALTCKNKTINNIIEQMIVADSVSTSHMVNSLKNITNLREVKTVVNIGNNKTIMVLLHSGRKGYQKYMVNSTR